MDIQTIFDKITKRHELTFAELEQYTEWALTPPHHGRGNGEAIRTLSEYRRRALDASDSMVTAAETEQRGLFQ